MKYIIKTKYWKGSGRSKFIVRKFRSFIGCYDIFQKNIQQ